MRTNLQTAFAGFTLALILSSAVAAQSQPDENPADASRMGKISGRVVNEGGQPLPEAVVSIRGYGGRGASQTSTTDSEGSFEFNGLDPVAYLISASFPGYVLAPRDPDVNPIGYYRVGDSVRIQMIKGGVITGTVTMSTGEPVVAVPVRAYMIRDSKGQPARYGTPFQDKSTDDRGVYRFYGLAPGTYLVAAGGISYSYVVNAYGTDVPTYAPSSTRDTAAEIFVHSGEEIADVDIRYRGESGHAVGGVVTSKLTTDQPQGFSITLVSTFNGTSQPSYSSFQPPGARGFSIYGVAPGDYTAIAQSYLPATGEAIVSEPLRIRVRGADVTGLELTTAPLGSISGHISLMDSNSTECKDKRQPLFGETLVAPWHNEKNTAKDQPQFVWGLGGPVLPDKQGDFTLRNLAPGQYRFSVRPMAKYWYLKSISWQSSAAAPAKAIQENRPADAARNWTTLKAGERLSGLTITLAEGAASLQGQIEVAEGRTLPPRMFVYLVPAEREKSNDVLRFFASIVSADGTFEMTHLSPGRYRIVAQTVAENESNILSKLRLPDEVEMRAKLLRDAEAIKIETELKPCQNVRDFRLPLKTPGSDQ
jgi:Carboxypeptidase regulatory-like domain